MTWPEPALFVWALAGFTTLGALLPLDVEPDREDHIVLTITATFVLAILGPHGLLLLWASALLSLALRRTLPGLTGRLGRGWWLLGTTGAITVGFSLAHPTYTVLLDRSYPVDASTGGDLALTGLVLAVAWVGTMSTRVALHALSVHRGAEARTGAAAAGPGRTGTAGGDGFDPFDSPLVPYLLPTVAGAPILAAALALYRPEAPWSAGATLLWCLPLYATCRFDLHRRHLAHQLRRDAAARQRLAAIGEVTARIVHQSRHQAGLMGWSIHRLRRLLADPSPDLTATTRELDVLTAAKQHIQDTFDRELLHETDSGPLRDATPAEPSSVAAIVAEVCSQLQPKAQRQGVALGFDVDEAPGRRDAPAQLREALFNLVDNAIDAATTAVLVTACPDGHSRDASGEILVSISDDGPGIAAAVENDLYEPFVSTKPRGTGMGLAIADALVAELGGRLHHERHDPTTRFVLAIPTPPARYDGDLPAPA